MKNKTDNNSPLFLHKSLKLPIVVIKKAMFYQLNRKFLQKL
ncbi:hypothetical protein EJK55_1723 [Moraxella catarrhalis]|uniref:Uncharacterized protein n=1 Tax=Moraxella catarrhalis TaxID=480 RepID=A0A3S9QI13_MORCA|nr:hypothetical protein MCR_1854 [Moraxella catarrhalis BBH18]AZQ88098.1 hypothetical protein EJK52_1903 [Moraxella catarrhalis]EKF82928.1 hypothetical protein MCRH_1927 [Moraxella catarrhalis RH4]AZQ90204.1 hypothetical protein EJK50_2001 [Moraxella catarrhalis]AZQ90980.1 hypothetical protein EJK51_1905 [Moraxella catarrhalis]